jgi:hypothetical protein
MDETLLEQLIHEQLNSFEQNNPSAAEHIREAMEVWDKEKRAWFIEPISGPGTPLQFQADHLLCQVCLNSRPEKVGAKLEQRTKLA